MPQVFPLLISSGFGNFLGDHFVTFLEDFFRRNVIRVRIERSKFPELVAW